MAMIVESAHHFVMFPFQKEDAALLQGLAACDASILVHQLRNLTNSGDY